MDANCSFPLENESFTIDDNDRRVVSISGWLKKKKRKTHIYSTNWSRRWFTVENDIIFWRHRQPPLHMLHDKTKEYGRIRPSTTTKAPHAGFIDLNDVKEIYKLKTLNIRKDIDAIFIVKSKTRDLCLMADSIQTRDRWVRGLQMLIDLKSGGTSSGPKGAKNRRLSNGGGDKYTYIEKQISTSRDEITALKAKLEEKCKTSL
mmetsp:Transcript_63400/g.76222  ORF Transcript_63400/g.76222 Transcript_63400/m.76222 type:complete len:203 (+) Transcript_63400:53-661(+)